jgi:hypothetical protein
MITAGVIVSVCLLMAALIALIRLSSKYRLILGKFNKEVENHDTTIRLRESDFAAYEAELRRLKLEKIKMLAKLKDYEKPLREYFDFYFENVELREDNCWLLKQLDAANVTKTTKGQINPYIDNIATPKPTLVELLKKREKDAKNKKTSASSSRKH